MYHCFLLIPAYGTCVGSTCSGDGISCRGISNKTNGQVKAIMSSPWWIWTIECRNQNPVPSHLAKGLYCILVNGCTTFCLRPIFICIPHRSCINCLHPSVAPKAIRAVHISGKDLHLTCPMSQRTISWLFSVLTLASTYSATEMFTVLAQEWRIITKWCSRCRFCTTTLAPKLPVGVEPTTYWLQINCSAIEPR